MSSIKMSAKILDGKALSQAVRAELKVRVDGLRDRGVVPKLDVLVAVQDPSSIAYVNMKRKWAEAIGIEGEIFEVADGTTQQQLIAKINELNANTSVHGVLIQHQLPKHLDESEAVMALGAEK